MPTVSVNRDQLFQQLGSKFSDDEFQQLCFDFGIELDEVTTASKVANRQDQKVNPEDDYVIYKIDIPANRYDLLCIEGLITALRVFRKQNKNPDFVVEKPKYKIVVKSATGAIRPHVVCAVLRDVSFDKEGYNSFLDLQDKLHFNICRRRSLVSMGTHDLSKVDCSGPLVFDARKPEDIGFVPLTQTKHYDNARDLLDFYRSDPSVKHIKEYTDLIYNSPVYPVILDAKDRVMSLPPIINSDFSKMSQETKDIFIEITAIDENKANIVLNTLVSMFSRYCAKPNHVESVEVVYEDSGRTVVTPDMSCRPMTASVKYLNSISGVNLDPTQILELLDKMMLAGSYDSANHAVTVLVPPTRSDILHPCDVAEDMAIAYGYNNLKKRPLTTVTVGRQQPINQLTDLLRYEIAQAGFTEVLTLGLCSLAENYTMLRRENDGRSVSLSNPATKEFQVCRTSLLPGILKTMRQNRALAISKGVRLFEVSDVVLRDESNPIGAKNRRRVAALYIGPSAGFGVVHGLVDRIMELVEVDPTNEYNEMDKSRCILKHSETQYEIVHGDDPTFMPGQCADVVLISKDADSPKPMAIGTFGILHPEVLKAFNLEYPCSMLEMDLECFL
jgi:phenylalanyl-tRNA synthetase beta chain